MTLLNDLKSRARQLHRAAAAGERSALARLQRHPDLESLTAANTCHTLRRRHCLAVLAMECGFDGWSHLTAIIGGATEGDFGSLLNRRECAAHWNIWSASYAEARAIREQHGGYLLPYKRHFLVVDRYYLETLGLDPENPAWTRMGRDWVRPTDRAAREVLYAQLIAARLDGGSVAA